MLVSRIDIFDYRFAKNSHLMHALEYTTQRALTSFPISSLSLSLALIIGSTAIQIQTSLLPARALIHTCDLERAHGCERYAWKGSWLHKECGQASPRCVGDLIRCEYMQAPPNQSLPLLHRSRLEHTRRAPADRSANFNTSLPPSRPHRMCSCMYVVSEPQAASRCVYAYGCECVLRARQRGGLRAGRGGLFRSWRACARTTTRMYLTPEGYREAGRREGRRTEKRDAFLHNRKHDVAYTRARMGFQKTRRARDILQLISSHLNARLRFCLSWRRRIFLSVSPIDQHDS